MLLKYEQKPPDIISTVQFKNILILKAIEKFIQVPLMQNIYNILYQNLYMRIF